MIKDLMDDAGAICDLAREIGEEDLAQLVEEHVGKLESLKIELDSPTSATNPSGANVAHAYEAADVLPPGRVRHSPFRRVPAEESSREAVRILFEHAGKRFVPREWADQNYADPAERRYWHHVVAMACSHLSSAGVIEMGPTGKRGARHWYRVPHSAVMRGAQMEDFAQVALEEYRHRRLNTGTGASLESILACRGSKILRDTA